MSSIKNCVQTNFLCSLNCFGDIRKFDNDCGGNFQGIISKNFRNQSQRALKALQESPFFLPKCQQSTYRQSRHCNNNYWKSWCFHTEEAFDALVKVAHDLVEMEGIPNEMVTLIVPRFDTANDYHLKMQSNCLEMMLLMSQEILNWIDSKITL